MTPLQACGHPFFNDLRECNQRLPNGRELPPLVNFSDQGKDGHFQATDGLPIVFFPEHVRAFINTSLQPQATNDTVISGGTVVDGGTSPAAAAAAATSTSSAPSTGPAASGE